MRTEKMPHELDRDEILLFARAVAAYPQSGGERRVSELVYCGHYRLFVIDHWTSKTLAIVTVLENPDESRYLHIAMLAGTGSLPSFELALGDLIELGRDEFCEQVTGIIESSAWEKFKEHGAFSHHEHVLVSFDTDVDSKRVKQFNS